jgi:hypothetical protein
MKIVNWPVHTFARWVNRESRRYPELRILQSHLFVSVTSGAVVLVVSFFVADWFHHAVWSATIERRGLRVSAPFGHSSKLSLCVYENHKQN